MRRAASNGRVRNVNAITVPPAVNLFSGESNTAGPVKNRLPKSWMGLYEVTLNGTI